MTADTVTVPISAIMWLGGVIVTMLGSLFSVCAHILLNINRAVSALTTDIKVDAKAMDLRVLVLERHDQNNQEEQRNMARYMREQGTSLPRHPHQRGETA